MIREKFERIKPHLNIGTIGHIDHGKTTLTAALTAVLSTIGESQYKKYEEIDDAPEEKERGITINASRVEYSTPTRHFSHVDCPGHADYIKNMITGTTQMDGAIVVISALEGPEKQTIEHLLLAKQLGLTKIVIFVNKEDLIKEADDYIFIEEDIRELLKRFNFDSINTPIIFGSALSALDVVSMNSSIKRGENKWVDKIFNLVDALDTYFDLPIRDNEKPFFMPIEESFSIQGRGTVVAGCVTRGSVNIGDTVEIVGFTPEPKITTVTGIEMFQKTLDTAIAGDNVGLLLRGIKKEDISRGMVVSKPKSLTGVTTFKGEVYILSSQEGGRQNDFTVGYKPQFYFHTIDMTGEILSIENNNSSLVVTPGSNVLLTIKFIYPVALEANMRFAIREGGKTIGAGIVSTLIN